MRRQLVSNRCRRAEQQALLELAVQCHLTGVVERVSSVITDDGFAKRRIQPQPGIAIDEVI